jgi:hypothetical protein
MSNKDFSILKLPQDYVSLPVTDSDNDNSYSIQLGLRAMSDTNTSNQIY